MTKANSPHLLSLRKRALFFSAAISLLIITISVSGYSNFKNIQSESSQNLLKRDGLLVRLNLIRSEILDSYKSLNRFLLEPENLQHQQNIIINVDEAIRIGEELSQNPWVIKYKRKNIATALNKKLHILKKESVRLIDVRLDVNNQYPSLAVGATIMQPNRNKLTNLIALAMNEMELEKFPVNKPATYQLLIKVRHLWVQALSNSRLYLANRVGSFNEKSLPVQERSIETIFNQLMLNLNKLKMLADAGKLGFESTDAVDDMLVASKAWFKGFQKVKVINHSDEWRQDAKIMKEKISPAIDSIIDQLVKLEQIITVSSQDDVKSLASIGDSQNKILWFIAFIGIFFTSVIILALDKLVFKPISMVSDALKLEASGRKSDHIPVVKTRETQNLIDAFSEMSRQVHIRQTELEYRALHDSLTSLPNRTLLLDRIEHDINIARRESHHLSLLIIDLDNFKEVNDTLGHHAGDSMLVEVGNRIKKSIRDVDTVARIGGDEFSILLPHTDENQAVILSQKVLSSFNKEISIEGVEISISASIGISVFPEHGEDMHSLLRHADVAMYVAKRNKLGFEVYKTEDDEHTISRLSMTKDFRDAMNNDDLILNYQPVFDIKAKNIIGVEALSRWIHPEHGYVSPEKFISIAEQMGLINNLTYWVLDKAIAQTSEWNKQESQLTVAVNLSVFSFKDIEFIAEVRSALKKYHFPAENLKLEITESAMMENPLQAIEVLTELHDMGVKLSVDDFGTGFSSMSYLKRLPVDELKIDKSFIIGLDSDESNDAIVRSTIDLAHNLGLSVVAEGIETKVVNDLLFKYNCDMAQGFYLGHPVTADEITALLKG